MYIIDINFCQYENHGSYLAAADYCLTDKCWLISRILHF